MQEQDIIPRIQALCMKRSWTFYRLAKESGIPYSTLCTMLHKANAPSIPTLIRICNGFGITLAEFFDTGSEVTYYTPEQKELMDQWALLNRENQSAVQKYIRYLLSQQT